MDIKLIIEKIAKLIDSDPNNNSDPNNLINVVNIATLSDGDEFLEQKSSITLSIVNISEDKTLKNQSIYQKKSGDNTIDIFAHPPKYLIFSILFASYNIDQSKYLDGLWRLQKVIDFFQRNNSFFYKLTEPAINEVITFPIYNTKPVVEKENYAKVTFLSVNLNMDQTNQMWSYLGSKYMPSVLYEMRVLPIQKNESANRKGIEEIEINVWTNDRNDSTGHLETVISI